MIHTLSDWARECVENQSLDPKKPTVAATKAIPYFYPTLATATVGRADYTTRDEFATLSMTDQYAVAMRRLAERTFAPDPLLKRK